MSKECGVGPKQPNPLQDPPSPPLRDPPDEPMHDPAGDPTYEPEQPFGDPTPAPGVDLRPKKPEVNAANVPTTANRKLNHQYLRVVTLRAAGLPVELR